MEHSVDRGVEMKRARLPSYIDILDMIQFAKKNLVDYSPYKSNLCSTFFEGVPTERIKDSSRDQLLAVKNLKEE